jgi:hypothetical protein
MNKFKIKHQVSTFNPAGLLSGLFFFFFTSHSFAFLGVNETAELIPAGQYRVGYIPQNYLGNGGGLENGMFLDIPIDQDINSRVELGFGVTDFWASGSIKWIPIPDYQNQPAMGLRGKIILAREMTDSFFNTQITPMLSKKYKTDRGTFIPYTGLPITLIYENSTKNTNTTQFCFGSEWVVSPKFQMGAEIDLSISGDTNMLSLYFNFQFDERIGFKK